MDFLRSSIFLPRSAKLWGQLYCDKKSELCIIFNSLLILGLEHPFQYKRLFITHRYRGGIDHLCRDGNWSIQLSIFSLTKSSASNFASIFGKYKLPRYIRHSMDSFSIRMAWRALTHLYSAKPAMNRPPRKYLTS